jgi:diguanylate cyclase (GGDEF)-like protein
MKLEREIVGRWVMVFGLLTLGAVGVLSNRRTQSLLESTYWVAHSLEVIGDLRQLDSELTGTEDAWRGYALFHDENDLDAIGAAIPRVSPQLQHIRQLTIDNIGQQQRLDLLEPIVSQRLSLLRKTIPTVTTAFKASPQLQNEYTQSQEAAGASRRILAEMENEEQILLVDRQRRAAHAKSIATLLINGGSLLALIFFSAAIGLGQWEIIRRRKIEIVFQDTQGKIAASLDESQKLGHEQNILGDLAARLQSCLNLTEGLPFICRSMERLFPHECGSVYLTSSSRNVMEIAVSWGSRIETAASFAADECWALRWGQLQVVDASDGLLRCPHLTAHAGTDVICLPLAAQRETLGVICVYCPSVETLTPKPPSGIHSLNRIRVATLVGAQISLAVANLKLQETLRNQSIRDPLTGLFNRRYMEESLAREFPRAKRKKSSLAVLMIDIDHFKQFNDTYGHGLGDLLLAEFGRFLGASIRGEDIACRYGGEEFTLILPDAPIEGASMRAKALCGGARLISIPLKDGGTSTITISIGLAVYPEHGATPETVLRAADAALYQAKSAGRDCLIIAPSPVTADLLNPLTIGTVPL